MTQEEKNKQYDCIVNLIKNYKRYKYKHQIGVSKTIGAGDLVYCADFGVYPPFDKLETDSNIYSFSKCYKPLKAWQEIIDRDVTSMEFFNKLEKETIDEVNKCKF